MGGPWFTVQKSDAGWQPLGNLWLSNGEDDVKGRLELRVSLEEFDDAHN